MSYHMWGGWEQMIANSCHDVIVPLIDHQRDLLSIFDVAVSKRDFLSTSIIAHFVCVVHRGLVWHASFNDSLLTTRSIAAEYVVTEHRRPLDRLLTLLACLKMKAFYSRTHVRRYVVDDWSVYSTLLVFAPTGKDKSRFWWETESDRDTSHFRTYYHKCCNLVRKTTPSRSHPTPHLGFILHTQII